jgi:hypothetical protein
MEVSLEKILIIIALLLILVSLLVWREASFILAGIGIVLLGVSAMLHLHK